MSSLSLSSHYWKASNLIYLCEPNTIFLYTYTCIHIYYHIYFVSFISNSNSAPLLRTAPLLSSPLSLSLSLSRLFWSDWSSCSLVITIQLSCIPSYQSKDIENQSRATPPVHPSPYTLCVLHTYMCIIYGRHITSSFHRAHSTHPPPYNTIYNTRNTPKISFPFGFKYIPIYLSINRNYSFFM